MSGIRGYIALVLLLPVTGLLILQGQSPAKSEVTSEVSTLPTQVAAAGAARASYARLPLMFEPNRGQTDGSVKFLSRRGGYVLFLTANEAVFKLPIAPVLKPEAMNIPVKDIAKGETPEAWMAHAKKGGRPLWAGRDEGLKRTAPGRPPWAGSDVEFDNKPMTRSATVRMKLVDANPSAGVTGRDQLPGVVNYYKGLDPANWHTDIPLYKSVFYDDVYQGVDLVYYGNPQRMEYDFIVSPGADPSAITLEFKGADAITVNEHGDVVLQVAERQLIQRKPFTYQEIDGARKEVSSRYVLADARVSFALGPYDATKQLFIDPVFEFSTFLGGSGTDQGLGIAVNTAGNAHVTGKTSSIDFPTENEFQEGNNTTLLDPEAGHDAFVTKLNPEGTALVYSTYLGGQADDRGQGIALDAVGNAYVTGYTNSSTPPTRLTPAFPTTENAYQRMVSKNEGGCLAPDLSFNDDDCFDAFLTKLSPSGNVLYSTVFGGSGAEAGLGIAVTPAGIAFITGYTQSYDFPSTRDVFQRRVSDPDEGQANSAASGDEQNNTPPPDAFVAKFDATKAGEASLLAATALGGGSVDRAYAITLDANGRPYVTGSTSSRTRKTESNSFPLTTGAFDRTLNTREPGNQTPLDNDCCDSGADMFVTRFNAALTRVQASTYLGAFDGPAGTTESFQDGNTGDQGHGIAIGANGNVYVVGFWGGGCCQGSPAFPNVGSTLFPTTESALDRTFNGGEADAILAKLNPGLTRLLYSTVIGGGGSDVAWGLAVSGNVAYLVGTIDPNFENDSSSDDNSPRQSGFPLKNQLSRPAPVAGVYEGEDAFLVVVDTSKSGLEQSLLLSTTIGSDSGDTATGGCCSGLGEDTGRGIALLGPDVFITGGTVNSSFPTTGDAFDTSLSGPEDAYVARIDTVKQGGQ